MREVAGNRQFFFRLNILTADKIFYIYASVRHWSILIIVLRDATQSSLFIILQVHSTLFGCQPNPSSGVHKNVTTVLCGQASLATSEGGSCTKKYDRLATLEGGSCTKNMTSTGGQVTVLCTPDDGCVWHPKHVEWTCRIMNRLFCVTSRWTIINIDADKILCTLR